MVEVPPEWAGQFGTVLIAAMIGSAALTLVLTPLVMPLLRRWKMGQSVRDDGPKSHLVKQGTPTMGGALFLVAALATTLFFAPSSDELWWVLAFFLAFGVLGFADDFIKIVLRRPLGLKARYKLIVQITLAVALAIYVSGVANFGTAVQVPWLHWQFDLGPIYPVFILLLVLGTTNATNLTDGLDGLLASTAIIVFIAYAIISLSMGKISLTIANVAIVGGLLGFLWYNKHPARIFMGDTGSLALGGALAAMAVVTKTELLLPIIGMLYVIEALSVIVQVASFRLLGRRLLRMSPLHHHFELTGWHEVQIVLAFTVFTLAAAITGLSGFAGWGAQ